MAARTPSAIRWVFLAMGLLAGGSAGAEPVTVSSLQELMPYLQQDDVELKMKPGVYTFTAEDAKAGKYGRDSFESGRKTLMLFEGSGGTYDFTDVTINVETGVYTSMGKQKIYELQTMGNRNVIKNLTLTDVGSVHDAPRVGVISVVMDGANNRIEGLHLTTKGSAPYGYGELFGKSSKPVIPHKKHSAFLIRGNSNHAKDCHIIHRAFGHAYVMQAAQDPLIEGCYTEGEMRKTDDLLREEKGTGSEADKVDFMTAWGYRVPRGFMYCLSEAGIRAYNTGNTYVDGKTYKRGTSNPTILNCTIKNARAGVTLTHATGKKYVEGTTTIGCTRGFAIGTGDIVDCYSDVQYGPALGTDYERDTKVNAEITLLPHEGETVNGAGQVAYLIGSKHNVVFHSKITDPDRKLVIQVGGKKIHIGGRGDKKVYAARGIKINNASGFRVVMDKSSEDCVVQSVGPVKDAGQKNQVKQVRQLRLAPKLKVMHRW